MEVKNKPQAVAGSYSKDPNAELDAALQKNYVGMRFQQGKPILDRELNLLGALSNTQRLAQRYIGNGVPDGDDGFLISDVKIDANDFTIKKGRCLVNGYEVVLDADTTYQKQPLINETLDFNFGDGSESVYDVHLHVDTREVSSIQDPALQNDSDIGFETTLREKVVWKVLVTKAGMLTDLQMSDLCLLAQVDARNATPDNKRVTDRRVTGLTMAQIRQRITETPEDLVLNTLKVKNRVDVGTATPIPTPDTSQTLTAARNAANAAQATVGAFTNLYDALNKPELLKPLQSIKFSLDPLKQNAQTAKTAAQTAQAAVDAATNGDASQVLAAARTAAEQANIAAGMAQGTAETVLALARTIGLRGADNPQLLQIKALIEAQSTSMAQSADDANRAATDAVTSANALDAAITNASGWTKVAAAAKLAVSGETYLQGDLRCVGRVGVGTTEPKATLHVAGGNGDLNATEGDLRIGDDKVRLKIGVDARAGEARLRASGAKLILGSGAQDVLTINDELIGMLGPPLVNVPETPMQSPDGMLKAADASVEAAKRMAQAADGLTQAATNMFSQPLSPEMTKYLRQASELSASVRQHLAEATEAAQRAHDKSSNPRAVPPEVVTTAQAVKQAVADASQLAGLNSPVKPTSAFNNANENLAMRNNDASKAADDALAQANEITRVITEGDQRRERIIAEAGAMKPREIRATYLSVASNVGIGVAKPDHGLHVGGGKSVRYELGAGNKLSLGGAGTLEVDAPNIVGGRLIVTDSGNVGVGVAKPGATLHLKGGQGDLNATEGDLKIGDNNHRLKIGVDLNTGDVRVRAQSASNKLILGCNDTDVLTVQQLTTTIPPPPAGNAVAAAMEAAQAAQELMGSAQLLDQIAVGTQQAPATAESARIITEAAAAARNAANAAAAAQAEPSKAQPQVVEAAAQATRAASEARKMRQIQVMLPTSGPGVNMLDVRMQMARAVSFSSQLMARYAALDQSIAKADKEAGEAKSEADLLAKALADFQAQRGTQTDQNAEVRSTRITVAGDAHVQGQLGIGLPTPSALLDIQGGADSNGNNDPKALAFSYRNGGYRHWIRTRHNSAASTTDSIGNAIDFYLNSSTTADGSNAPGTGSIHTLTLDSGNVGIRRTDPQVPLHIRQSLSGHGIMLDEADANGNVTGKSFRIHYEGQGNIVFYQQDGKGQWMGPSGTWNSNSDLSLKEQVSPMADVLERVMRLKPVNFVWKDDQTPDSGFVAQDVEQVFPEIVCSVKQDGRDVKGLPYTSFGVFAIAAIQELKQRYDEKIRALEEKVASLARRVSLPESNEHE
jgi:hypothetical protein